MLPRAKVEQMKRQKRRRKWLRRMVVLGVALISGMMLFVWFQSDFEPRPHVNLADDTNLSSSPHPSDHSNEARDVDSGNHSFDDQDGEKPIVDDRSDDNVLPNNEEDNQTKVEFAFVGDIMFSGNVERLLLDQGFDYPYVHVKEYLQEADLTIANLETPITTRGEPEDKSYTYRSSPDALPALVDSGVDIVNLANNHILDYGLIGLLDTFDHLNQVGLKYIGAGNDADEAYTPVIVEKKGMKVAFFGLSQVVPEVWWKADRNHPGVAETYDYTRPVKAIESIRDEVDLIVVVVHWGVEREAIPNDRQTNMAHRYIDAGADLVIGGHPHVLQSIEQYNGKWIVYSLGNFIFTTNQNPETWETVILQATCSNSGDCNIQLVPILTKWAQPKPMARGEATSLLARLSEISTDIEIDPDGTVHRSENNMME